MVFWEVLNDGLFGEVLNVKEFVVVVLVVEEGGVQMGSTGANGSNVPLLQDLQGSSCVFIA